MGKRSVLLRLASECNETNLTDELKSRFTFDRILNGTEPPIIMDILSHASMSTTSGFYSFVTFDMVRKAMEKAGGIRVGTERRWKDPEFMDFIYTLD